MDVILTCYLTGRPDPQRGTMWKTESKELEALARSCPAPLVVFANELAERPGYEVEIVEGPSTSVYFERWGHYQDYLETHPKVRYAFCVDATDVLCLRDPFPYMEPGVLYCGSEPLSIGESPWMWNHHEPLWAWMSANRGRALLNPGIVGGDRATIVRLCRRMLEEQRGLTMDMGAFNLVAYEEFRIVTGPTVHTLYKANERTTPAWFKHK